MVLQIFTLDPAAAAALTDNEHVDAINAASNQITRVSSVSAAARPLEADEVTSTEIADGSVSATDMATGAARDNIVALPKTSRRFVETDPQVGEFKITAIQRDSAGLLEVEFDDVAEA